MVKIEINKDVVKCAWIWTDMLQYVILHITIALTCEIGMKCSNPQITNGRSMAGNKGDLRNKQLNYLTHFPLLINFLWKALHNTVHSCHKLSSSKFGWSNWNKYQIRSQKWMYCVWYIVMILKRIFNILWNNLALTIVALVKAHGP